MEDHNNEKRPRQQGEKTAPKFKVQPVSCRGGGRRARSGRTI